MTVEIASTDCGLSDVTIADLWRRAFGPRKTAEHAASFFGLTMRRALAWIHGERQPNFTQFMNMLDESEALQRATLRILTEAQLHATSGVLPAPLVRALNLLADALDDHADALTNRAAEVSGGRSPPQPRDTQAHARAAAAR